jgi:flagellar basal body-associated protein FliL
MVVMASDGESTKDQAPKEDLGPVDSGEVVDPSLMSTDELDRLIAESDPEFKARVDEIGSAGAAADLNIELIDLDELLADQNARSLRSRLRHGWRKLRSFLVGLQASAWHWLREDLVHRLKDLGGWLKARMGEASEGLRQFGFKPLKYKLTVIGFLFFAVAVAAVLWVGLTRGLVPRSQPLFMRSLAEIATGAWEYDPVTEKEAFYDSFRTAQNIFVIQRLVVNLKPSTQSGSNPMAMAEVFVEGVSPDVIVEIKDREIEFKDALLRTMEDFSYDELISEGGKRHLADRLGREADRLATQGRVRRVYFRNLVLKP